MTRFTTPLICTALALPIGLGFVTTPAADAAILAGDVIVIDFGKTGQLTAGNWNNVARDATGASGLFPTDTSFTTENPAATAITISGNLIRYSDGAATGVNLAGRTIKSGTGAFAGIGGASAVADNTLAFPATGVIPDNAQIDLSFFNQGKTILSLTGLDDSLTYNLSLLSKITDARDANTWIANEGLASQQSIVVDPNDTPFVYSFIGLTTNGSGVITFSVTTADAGGTASAHINALELTAIPEPATATLLALAGLILHHRRKRA